MRLNLLLMLLLLVGCTTTAETGSRPTSTPTSRSSPETVAATPKPTAAITAPPTATTVAPTDTPTAAPSPAPSATATTFPSPTPPAPIVGTLLFYTAPITGADGQAYWAIRTSPPLPQFDPALFDDLYGPWQGVSDFSLFFADRQPQLSPDGQTLLVPGLTAYPQYGAEGTGTWVIDVMTGAARQLLPDGVSATWNPTGDTITYGDGDTLFTLGTAEGATPQAIFQHPDLWAGYAKWSPDGQWIAAVTGATHEPAGEAGTDLTFTYWLVPPGGGPARELAQLETYSMGYGASNLSWSPDGQFLLAHYNRVYDLAGNQLMPDDIGGVEWLPDRPQLLYGTDGTLRVITPTGDEIARIEDVEARGSSLAFSPDGRRLAFSQPREGGGFPLAVYDFDSGETQRIGITPDAAYFYPLRWSADGATLIFTAGVGDGRDDIWTMPVTPGSTARLWLADAALIEALPWGQ